MDGWIPGDYYVLSFGEGFEVPCIIMEVEGGRPTKYQVCEKDPLLLKLGFFEEGEEYVIWTPHFCLS